MSTITIQIGNTDGKLTQKMWAAYCEEIDNVVRAEGQVHFHGGPPIWMPWQNCCWVVLLMSRTEIETLQGRLTIIRKKFSQDSIAWTTGETDFI